MENLKVFIKNNFSNNKFYQIKQINKVKIYKKPQANLKEFCIKIKKIKKYLYNYLIKIILLKSRLYDISNLYIYCINFFFLYLIYQLMEKKFINVLKLFKFLLKNYF